MEAKKNPKQDLQRQSFKFFLIGLSISVVLTITAFEWRTKKSKQIPPTFDTPIEALLEVKATVHEVIPPAPIPIKTNNIKSLVNLTLIETKNAIPEVETDLPTVETNFDSLTISIADEPTVETFYVVEVMPAPVGGYKSFYEQLSNSIKYPRKAQRNQTQGKVFVEFIIDQLGSISDLKIAKGIGDGCDEEAMRVLSQTRWQPGKQRGIPVKVRMILPLTFKLN